MASPLFPETRRLLIACSGGPDSVALLDWADAWRRETGAALFAAHVDHGLRGAASRRDADFVRRLCARRGIPCAVLRAPVAAWAKTHRQGTEEAARQCRYRALARAARRFRCAVVATGHNRNDQVETVFLNLIRGAGPAGLAGMAGDSPWPVPVPGRPPRLWRPLLGLSRQEILTHLRARGLSWRTDRTNAEPVFLRNRLRPVLNAWEKLRPGFFERVARTAAILRDEEADWRRRLGFPRRKKGPERLDIPRFLSYSIVEQRRRLRHLHGLAHFEALERVRLFAAGRAPGPLDIPGARVHKIGRRLVFRRRRPGPTTARFQ